jgi:multiple sugar transport system substrate-binding protein
MVALACLAPIGEAVAGEAAGLAYFRQAKINWRQAEGQKLTIGLNKHPFTESLLPLIGEFETLTGIKVDYLILPENEYFSKLVADLSNQRGEFTVIMTGPMRNWQYATPGWIHPLDDFLKNPKLTDPAWYKFDDFFPGLIAANRWSGKTGGGVGEGPLYAVPVLGETYILAYRKDLFDQHKIKVPTTLEEMAAAARAVKQKAGIDGIVARGAPNTPTIATGFISGAKSFADGKWHEIDENLNPRFHDPVHVKFVEQWVDMIRESGPANWANMTWYDAMEAFAAGQAGMIADADFFAATYEDPKKSKVAGKVGYALIPPGPAGTTYSGLWTWALGMSKATKNKEAAWLFIQWATSARTLLNATVEYRNYNPARASVMSNSQVQKIMGQWGNGNYLDVLQKNLKTARVAWVPNPERTRLGDIWARALHEVYFKRLSAEEAMKRASAEMEKVFRDVGLKK